MAHPVSHEVFRARVAQLIERTGMSHAAFARAAGMDRSTLSQLLAGPLPRLPRAGTLALIARAGHVSVDWLLGLSAREEPGAEIIEAVLQVEPYGRVPAGEPFLAWLQGALGSRVCTVPIGIPDFLKLDEVLAEDYPQAGTALAASMQRRRAIMRHPQHLLEVCFPEEALLIFAQGIGRWRRLDPALRRRQMLHMAALADELYPAVRIHLYEAGRSFSAHYTVFGAQRVAIFLGASWLVLNAAQHVEMFTQRFGELVRQATVQPHGFAAHVRGIAEQA